MQISLVVLVDRGHNETLLDSVWILLITYSFIIHLHELLWVSAKAGALFLNRIVDATVVKNGDADFVPASPLIKFYLIDAMAFNS